MILRLIIRNARYIFKVKMFRRVCPPVLVVVDLPNLDIFDFVELHTSTESLPRDVIERIGLSVRSLCVWYQPE